ncbi:MAG: tRNA lysidine(34) synthetase TilS [Chloroflexi bacterium]|nr:tRNA lysidine(34) synthetase TilS [Chloroflexota bacterium]
MEHRKRPLDRPPAGTLPAPGAPLVAAVSGGADSLCLLGTLLDLGHRPLVAHVNHSLHPQAGDWAARVQALARDLGLDFALTTVDAAAFARAGRHSLEEAARLLRYASLARTAIQHGAAHIATGHTAGDQAETVLMHFLRGAGLAGLRGMTPAVPLAALRLPVDAPPDLLLVRPLLGLTRADTEAYCAARGWTPVADPSNADTALFRNRLRHELLPLLAEYNPNIRQVLARTAEVLAADYEALAAESERAWAAVAVRAEPGAVWLDRAGLLALPLAHRRGVTRIAISSLRPGLRDIGFQTVARALAFAALPTASGVADLAAGLCLRDAGELLGLCEWDFAPAPEEGWPQMRQALPLPLPGGEVALPGGWQVTVETVALSGALPETPDRWTATVDAAAAGEQIWLRPRRPGDRLRPLGMSGSVKVAELMLNLKVPRAARAGWPLLANEREVLWVAGLRLGHDYRVTEETNRGVRITLSRGRA